MAARMASRRLSPLADDERAELGAGRLSEDRLSGPLLLFGAEERRRVRSRSTRSIPNCCGPTRSSAFRCASRRFWPASQERARRGGRGVRFRLGRHHLQGGTRQGRRHLLPDFGGGADPSRTGAEISRLGRAGRPTIIFATLNSAVFSDGSFVYVPPGVRCPMELSTYFRINEKNTGQFERTLIIADKGSYVSYLEGCTAPQARREPACTPRSSN